MSETLKGQTKRLWVNFSQATQALSSFPYLPLTEDQAGYVGYCQRSALWTSCTADIKLMPKLNKVLKMLYTYHQKSTRSLIQSLRLQSSTRVSAGCASYFVCMIACFEKRHTCASFLLPSSPYVFMAFSFYGSRKGRWRWDHGYQALSFVHFNIINIWKKKYLHLLANYAPTNSRDQFHTKADVILALVPKILNLWLYNIKHEHMISGDILWAITVCIQWHKGWCDW